MSKALSPLSEFTEALSGEQNTSVSYLKLLLRLFDTQVLKCQDDGTQLTTNIKESILNYLNEKCDDQITKELLDMASLIDPQFKIRYIKDERGDYMKARATAEVERLVSTSAATDVLAVPAKRQKFEQLLLARWSS